MNLENAGKKIHDFSLPTWDQLPDFQLYMDQVITIVNQELESLFPEKNLLTSAMVNNYVKQKLIPAPIKKRYGKEHVALLLTITLLKQILPLPEVKEALDYQKKFSNVQETYEDFSHYLTQAIEEIAGQMIAPENVSLSFNGEHQEKIFMRSITLALSLKVFSEVLIQLSKEEKGEENHES